MPLVKLSKWSWGLGLMLALLVTLAAATPAFAQDPAPDAAPDAAPAATAPDAAPAGNAAVSDGPGAVSFASAFFWSESMLGNLITWLLLAMSVVVIALLIHFLIQNRKLTIMPDETVSAVEALLDERKFKDAIELTAEDESVFGQVIHASLSEASNGFGAMERAVEETGDLALTRRIRPLEYLNVLGATGPMLGLFGTVYGMIVAFQTLAAKGSSVNPQDLAAGISTALVTTFWGLVVGIPAVAAYSLVRNRVDAMIAEAMVEAEDLIGRFRPGGTKKTSSSSSSAATPKPKAE
jgi:biopolymer transport protein ExbB